MSQRQENLTQNQNFWQLASIQSVALGLPGIVFGEKLAAKFGAGTAVSSIIIGNMILWLIGVVVISMISNHRINAMENVKSYLGKYGGILASIVFAFAFINWYSLQIYSSVSELDGFFELNNPLQKGVLVRFGAFLGLASALLSIGGIRLIKWIAIISLPALLVCQICAVVFSDYPVSLNRSWGLSFPGVLSTVLLLIPGMINLPTFFRHSRSRADSYLALTIMIILITFFQVSDIWIGPISHFKLLRSFNFEMFSCYVILILICNNLLNVYYASACWENIIPHFGGPKGYAIIGMIGTVVYTFVQISSPMLLLVNLANSYIASLSIVLLIAFLMRIIVKHRNRASDKVINAGSWLIGCVTATVLEVQDPQQNIHDIHALLVGVAMSAFVFLSVIFIEETLWSIKKIFSIKSFSKRWKTRP
jgi:purine-cytosine permease-like protein